MAEEEEEKNDADVFENHIDDLYLALHFSVFQELGAGKGGGGQRKGGVPGRKGGSEERMRGTEAGLIFNERSWRKCGGKFCCALQLFVGWWLVVGWLVVSCA